MATTKYVVLSSGVEKPFDSEPEALNEAKRLARAGATVTIERRTYDETGALVSSTTAHTNGP